MFFHETAILAMSRLAYPRRRTPNERTHYRRMVSAISSLITGPTVCIKHVSANIKGNIKPFITGSLGGETTTDQWFTLHNVQ